MEVDGVLPGDHLLLPRRSSLPLRHLSSPLLRVRVGDSAVWCSAAAREENPIRVGGCLLYELHAERRGYMGWVVCQPIHVPIARSAWAG